MPPSPTKRRAWVCSPGIWDTPFLRTFLDDLDLRASPLAPVEAIVGWGLKPTSKGGRRRADRTNLPYIALEDGFLRSVGLGETGAATLSLIVDDVGVYYDANRPSRLEQLLDGSEDWCDGAMRARARALIDSLVATGLSKTNMGEALDASLLRPGSRILLVDQTAGDASIACGLANADSFVRMVRTARAEHPDAQLIVKRHPAVAAGRKQGCIPDNELSGVTLIDADVRAADLLATVDGVWCVTSALGFEALLRDLPVRCFGAPFYSGWGLTTDEVDTGRRGLARDVETLAAACLIAYPRYVDPLSGQRCDAETAVERLLTFRDRAERLDGDWSAVGFAPAKRPQVRRLLNGPKTRLKYFASASRAAVHAERTGGRLVYWAGKESPEIAAAAAATSAPVVRMEDGFIRSRGLGSDFFGALSVALDDLGVYYDPSRPSRLEQLIEDGAQDAAMLARAARLRTRIVEAGLSKYNLATGPARPDWPAGRMKLLVVGQVENDKSILKGCDDIRTNSGLVEAARADFPDAFLIYRNHPDVMSGNRPGRLDAHAMAAVDAVADDLDIIDCLEACDTLATLTSLSGFEALLRGKAVSTYGRPFYGGWGLTTDRMTFERRTRRASLDALVAAALIQYPIYISPEGWPCEAEDLVERLIRERAAPAPPAPSNQIARWWKGINASLDRRPPPSY
ncbi:capsular polysaccharide biosynthesis protein [Brevundimonas bacteroides]|uniref:capsular polysaccharide biosynthesis protein n=1 Tax=Brevundimonas bacteroides TaxID=74311 RepID=UPI000A8EE11B|nr:capsular polysaccharide biosynthesis protein [Brevundimonas bacteroides]